MVLFQFLAFKSAARRRREAFERDYTAMLLSLASAIRTGLDPLVALASDSKNYFLLTLRFVRSWENYLRTLNEVCKEDEAVRKFRQTINHPDVQLFRTAFILARKEGSSLSECLQRLARVTQQRQSFRRKVRSAVAMQKLSAIGIGLCTVAIGGIQFVTNPDALSTAWNHPVGSKLLLVGLGLVGAGIGWMIKMASPKS